MIVIDMDMPKSCFECVYALTDAHGAYCALTDNEIKEGLDIYDGTNNRSAICPIKCGIEDIITDLQKLRNCSCSCSDGIIDDVEEIIDKHTSGDTNADSN